MAWTSFFINIKKEHFVLIGLIVELILILISKRVE